MTMDDATLAQVRAANPEASTWVAANAGSGKTRVLTDRVARLLLNGTQPQKILCLTYTKAAAAEMQNRLFKRLGEWAMMPDVDLRNALAELGEGADLDTVAMRKARTLFANALETPGGLKIQTIHSFCDKLLRRFPLEAGVSPQFEVLEDRQAKLMRAEILEDLASGAGVGAVDRLARFMSGLEPDALLAEIASKRRALDIDAVRALFPNAENTDPAALLDHVLDRDSREVLREAARVITAEQSTKTDAPKLENLASASTIEAFLKGAGGLLLFGGTAKAGPYSAKLDKLPSQKPTREAHPELVAALNEIMERTEEVYWLYVNHLALERAEAMAAFSTAFLDRYDQLKTQTGRLDYDDLIARAGRLLSGSKAAEWVLYKLDGGIDHVLVDEAQDTSPSQWDVVKLLTDEFTTGDSGKDTNRTVFVVGDEKQSIYSFQGADPAEFDVMRQRFSERLNGVQKRLEEVELSYSFRSADPILRLVDKVFDGPAGTGFLKRALHRPFKTDLPGRVDLWPFEEAEKSKDDTPWFKPVDTPAADNPQTVLARKIAGWIKHVLDRKQELPGQDRAIRPSDFLILVQGRRPIFHNIIKELKLLDLPVAGADRLDVGQELAVRDMLSLLKFADLPEDDLSLAEALRSPLLGFSEDDLFRVAQPRREKESLWQAMRDLDTRHPAQLAILRDVLKQADFMRPYELIERILTLHRGRENLLARLGPEAEDGIDELLSQAMRYEQLEAPSLPGFLNWFAAGKVEIKREMDSGAGQIRVMTVHGSKGLEAPIVILPDTEMRKGNNDSSQIMALKEGGFLWKSPEGLAPVVQNDGKEAAKEFADQERMRLLYVALTRAEQWLVVAGAGDRGKEGASWYNLVAEAMEQGDWMPVTGGDVAGVGPCLSAHHKWSEHSVTGEDETTPLAGGLPDWAHTPAPVVEKPPVSLSPSDLGGAKIVPGGLDGADKETALRRGRQVHLLLEHLAKTPAANRRAKAQQLLIGACSPADALEFDHILTQANAVLDDPALAHVFGKDVLAEVGISADIAQLGGRIDGIIDRLIIEETRVLAIDFKTNATVPDRPETIPDGILRQLAAYRAALVQIYPKHEIELAVLWTQNRQLMAVPHDIVMTALQTPTTS